MRLRVWAGPLTIGSFSVVAATGVLMFFHCNTGLMKVAHEWLGWLLVAGGVAHIVVNWNAFVNYFKRPAGVAIIAPFLVLGLATLVPTSGGRHGHLPFMEASRSLEQSSLNVLAQVVQQSPESLVERLEGKGLRVQDPKQTIREIAADNKVENMEVMGHIFRQDL